MFCIGVSPDAFGYAMIYCSYNCCGLFGFRRLCGSLGCYDIGTEKRVSLRNSIKLQTYNRIFHKVTTTDDPVIRKVSCMQS